VSDVLFHIVTLQPNEKALLSTALGRDLVFTLHSACYGQSPEQQDTIARVVAMWGDRGILDPGFVHSLMGSMRSAEKPPLDPLPQMAPPPMPQMPGLKMPGMLPMSMRPPGMQPMMQEGGMGPGTAGHGHGMPGPSVTEAAQRAMQLPVGLLIQHQSPGHRPYQPLDPATLPATAPPMRAPSADLLRQMDQFYLTMGQLQ